MSPPTARQWISAARAQEWIAELRAEVEQLRADKARCSSCDHEVSMHQEDGCWYTVTEGTMDVNLVCVCSVAEGAQL